MGYYRVTKTYTYTETVYIKSESSESAEEESLCIDGERNYDDSLYSWSAQEIEKEEFVDE